MGILRELKCKTIKTKSMNDSSPILLDKVQEAIIIGLHNAEEFYQKNKEKIPVEYLKAMKPYIDNIANTQTEHLVYLPANVGIYLLVRYFLSNWHHISRGHHL